VVALLCVLCDESGEKVWLRLLCGECRILQCLCREMYLVVGDEGLSVECWGAEGGVCM